MSLDTERIIITIINDQLDIFKGLCRGIPSIPSTVLKTIISKNRLLFIEHLYQVGMLDKLYAMRCACKQGNYYAVELLLAYGAPLHNLYFYNACEGGNIQIAKLFKAKGTLKDCLEHPIAIYLCPFAAAVGGHLELLKYLIDEGFWLSDNLLESLNEMQKIGHDRKEVIEYVSSIS